MKQSPPSSQAVIDATGKPLGRLASEIAVLLQGKHRASFERHCISGDIVHVQNVGRMILTGKKMQQKKYYRASGYPGGLKTESVKDIFTNDPAKVLTMAVKTMLPDNTLRKRMMLRLIIE